MAVIGREFSVAPGGGGIDEDVVSPEAWAQFSADAVWCSLSDLTSEGHVLRIALAPPVAVVERDGERTRVPSASAPALFWASTGVSSYHPHAERELDPAWLPALERWLDGGEAEIEVRPGTVLRLGLGTGEQLLRDEVLFLQGGAWMRARRLVDEVVVAPFSMRQLVLDLSLTLAEPLLHD